MKVRRKAKGRLIRSYPECLKVRTKKFNIILFKQRLEYYNLFGNFAYSNPFIHLP